jgi:hypothetical protein
MNLKNILTWTIAIVIGYIVIRIIFWIFKIVFSLFWILILAAGVYFVASLIHKVIFKRFLSK